MNRRQFLVRATIGGATVPLLFTEIGCSDDDDDNGNGGASETFRSDNVQGHEHTITIPDADFNAGGDQSYTTSNVSGHTHTVDLESIEMDNLSTGCVVIAPSSDNSGHSHTFRLVVASFVTSLNVTSSPAEAHTHQVTVPAASLLGNPPVQQNLTTSDFGGHFHSLVLDVGALTTLQACSSVNVTSGLGGSPAHSHNFLITRA
jgi:hypothetical protein